jgi:hypothetical protein
MSNLDTPVNDRSPSCCDHSVATKFGVVHSGAQRIEEFIASSGYFLLMLRLDLFLLYLALFPSGGQYALDLKFNVLPICSLSPIAPTFQWFDVEVLNCTT